MGKRILITGGTAFVSKFAAEYFVKRGYEVSVLNRGDTGSARESSGSVQTGIS